MVCNLIKLAVMGATATARLRHRDPSPPASPIATGAPRGNRASCRCVCRPHRRAYRGAMRDGGAVPPVPHRRWRGGRGADVRKRRRFRACRAHGRSHVCPPRGGTGDARVLDPLSKPVATKDGYICVSANTDAQAFALFDAIGRPELKADPRFWLGDRRGAPMCGPISKRASQGLAPTHNGRMAGNSRGRGRTGGPHALTRGRHGRRTSRRRKILPWDRSPSGEPRFSTSRVPNSFSAGSASSICQAPLIGGDSIEILREIGYRDSGDRRDDQRRYRDRRPAKRKRSLDRPRPRRCSCFRGNSDKGS